MRSIHVSRCAIVGGAGFLGSHLTDFLVDSRGCTVTVVDNLCAGRREFVHKDAEFVHHDITGSEEFLTKLFKARRIEYVFNYAAHPYVPDSFDRPHHVFNTNASGAIKVINAAQEAGCKAILQVSSAELYGSGGESQRSLNDVYYGHDEDEDLSMQRIKEDFPVEPHSTYGTAKAAVDYYCQCAWRERETPVIALRQFNCCGTRDCLHPYVIPAIVEQMQEIIDHGKCSSASTAVIRLGNNTSRDFLDADDAVRMAVELLERGEFGHVYNLGSEESIKIYDLAQMIGEMMGFKETKVVEDESRKRPWEIWHLAACNDKLYSVGVSKPKSTLRQAIEKTVKWLVNEGAR